MLFRLRMYLRSLFSHYSLFIFHYSLFLFTSHFLLDFSSQISDNLTMREYLEKLNSRYVKGYQIFTETVEKHSLYILWCGFLISLVTRLIFWNYYNFLTEDAIELARITAGWTSGQAPLFDLVWPPLYIFISSLFFKITSNAVLSVKLVAIISGSLLIFPVFYFVKRISSRYIAALTIVLFTLNSTLLDYSIDVNTNILFTLFVFLYLVIYAKFLIKPNVRSGVLLSLAAAAAYLTRTEGIFLFFWTILLFIYMVIKKRMSSFYHLWLYSVFVLIFFTLTIPYLGFLNDVSGRMSVGARQYHFTFFPKAEGDYALMKNKLARSGREIVEGELFRDRKDLNIKKLIRRYGRNLMHIAKRVRGKFIKNDLILLSIFFGVLIFIFSNRAGMKYLLPIVGFFILLPIAMVDYTVDARYVLFLLPLFLTFIAQALHYLSKRPAGAVFTSLFILIYAVVHLGNIPPLDYTYNMYTDKYILHKNAAVYLREKGSDALNIMGFSNDIPYYMGLHHIPFPTDADAKRLREYIAYNNVDLIVINEHYDLIESSKSILSEFKFIKRVAALNGSNRGDWFTEPLNADLPEVNERIKGLLDSGLEYELYRVDKAALLDELNIRLERAPVDMTVKKVIFQNGIEILGYQLFRLGDDQFKIELFMKTSQPVTRDLKMLIHIDNEGRRVNRDHYITNNIYPLQRWDNGEIVMDSFFFELPSDPEGEFTLFVGMYDPDKKGDNRIAIIGCPDTRFTLLEISK